MAALLSFFNMWLIAGNTVLLPDHIENPLYGDTYLRFGNGESKVQTFEMFFSWNGTVLFLIFLAAFLCFAAMLLTAAKMLPSKNYEVVKTKGVGFGRRTFPCDVARK